MAISVVFHRIDCRIETVGQPLAVAAGIATGNLHSGVGLALNSNAFAARSILLLLMWTAVLLMPYVLT